MALRHALADAFSLLGNTIAPSEFAETAEPLTAAVPLACEAPNVAELRAGFAALRVQREERIIQVLLDWPAEARLSVMSAWLSGLVRILTQVRQSTEATIRSISIASAAEFEWVRCQGVEEPPYCENDDLEVEVAEEAETSKPGWMCSTPGCCKPSWNQTPGEYCSRACRNGGAREANPPECRRDEDPPWAGLMPDLTRSLLDAFLSSRPSATFIPSARPLRALVCEARARLASTGDQHAAALYGRATVGVWDQAAAEEVIEGLGNCTGEMVGTKAGPAESNTRNPSDAQLACIDELRAALELRPPVQERLASLPA